jgi:hypothetical protein
MKKALLAWLLVALVAALAVVGPASAGAAGRGTDGINAGRQFSATGTISRYYTKQTVTGIYRNGAGRPVDVTLYDWQGNTVAFKHAPTLDTAFWGNYWHDTYGLDQWYVGQNSQSVFHLMLPPAPMGSTFTALLVTEFKLGGNWQNWMDGTSG